MASTLTGAQLRHALHEASRARRFIARRLTLPSTDTEDLHQDLLLGLVRSVRHYDPRRGTFGAFVGRAVFREASRLLRRRLRETRLTVLMERFDVQFRDDGKELPVQLIGGAEGNSCFCGPQDAATAVERKIDVRRLLHLLTADERLLCQALLERPRSEVYEICQISRATMYRRLGELRTRFAAAGLGTYV